MPSNEINVCEVYEKDKKLKKEEVINVMKWVQQQPHLPNISELDTALFLHSCYYNNEIAKITIDTHFTVRTLWSDIFGTSRDSQLKTAINTTVYVPIPTLGPNEELVILAKLADTSVVNYNFPLSGKCFDMFTLLHLHQNGPPNGLIIVFDMEGFTFTHFLKININTVKKVIYYLQEAMPIRLKGIHYCNIVPFMDKILALMKPFLKEELFNLITLHTGIETLFDHIPKKKIPEDYGGTFDSVQVLHEKYKAQMNDNEEFFKYVDSQVVDESKRPGKPPYICEVYGMEGTFKRLELD